ncbi:MAG: hypothetical protein FJ100_16080 [Deltaproteobacteria bacterium]|nr:hypothetical protein [Deltaproteobacteria bacterium]
MRTAAIGRVLCAAQVAVFGGCVGASGGGGASGTQIAGGKPGTPCTDTLTPIGC